MKKKFILFLYLTLCLSMTSCNKKTQVVKDVSSLSPTESLVETLKSNEDTDVSGEEEALLKTVGFQKETKFQVSKYCWDLFQAKKTEEPSIEDRVYKVSGVNGKSDVHYPYFKGKQGKYDVLNSIILAKIVDEYGYSSLEGKVDRKITYKLEYITDDFISIFFSGNIDYLEGNHGYPVSYAVNFDLKHNAPVSMDEIIDTQKVSGKLQEALLEKIHNAMREQLDKSIADSFENITVEEIEKQLYQRNFYYISDGRIYLQFSLNGGIPYIAFVHFDMDY